MWVSFRVSFRVSFKVFRASSRVSLGCHLLRVSCMVF